MKKYIYDEQGEKLLAIEEDAPDCGEDFCDRCGDCLDCYAGDRCYEAANGEHWWVQYGENDEAPH